MCNMRMAVFSCFSTSVHVQQVCGVHLQAEYMPVPEAVPVSPESYMQAPAAHDAPKVAGNS
jgi:hypothetical protein